MRKRVYYGVVSPRPHYYEIYPKIEDEDPDGKNRADHSLRNDHGKIYLGIILEGSSTSYMQESEDRIYQKQLQAVAVILREYFDNRGKNLEKFSKEVIATVKRHNHLGLEIRSVASAYGLGVDCSIEFEDDSDQVNEIKISWAEFNTIQNFLGEARNINSEQAAMEIAKAIYLL